MKFNISKHLNQVIQNPIVGMLGCPGMPGCINITIRSKEYEH